MFLIITLKSAMLKVIIKATISGGRFSSSSSTYEAENRNHLVNGQTSANMMKWRCLPLVYILWLLISAAMYELGSAAAFKDNLNDCD